MGKYLEQCEKCGDETITYGWYPERCPFCELAEVRKQRDTLAEALQELNDAPWLNMPGRAGDIVQDALAAAKGGSDD
jgi:hypothetical protein